MMKYIVCYGEITVQNVFNHIKILVHEITLTKGTLVDFQKLL